MRKSRNTRVLLTRLMCTGVPAPLAAIVGGCAVVAGLALCVVCGTGGATGSLGSTCGTTFGSVAEVFTMCGSGVVAALTGGPCGGACGGCTELEPSVGLASIPGGSRFGAVT